MPFPSITALAPRPTPLSLWHAGPSQIHALNPAKIVRETMANPAGSLIKRISVSGFLCVLQRTAGDRRGSRIQGSGDFSDCCAISRFERFVSRAGVSIYSILFHALEKKALGIRIFVIESSVMSEGLYVQYKTRIGRVLQQLIFPHRNLSIFTCSC